MRGGGYWSQWRKAFEPGLCPLGAFLRQEGLAAGAGGEGVRVYGLGFRV